MEIIKTGQNTKVLIINGTRILISYDTPVARVDAGIYLAKTEEKHSATTTKHINKWFRSMGINPETVETKPQRFFNIIPVESEATS